MISIIIPVYNQAEKLNRCLRSILDQTYENYEVIIVNDGSTDGFEEVIDKYRDNFGYKLKISSQDNQGANPARNQGAKMAKGEFLLFCDADITMRPDMLKLMHAELSNNPNKSFVYSSFKWGWKKFRLFPFDAAKLEKMPYIHTTSLIRKEHFPGFDNNIKRLQDWDLWLTMLQQGHTGVWVNQILFTVQPGGYISAWLPSAAYRVMPFLSKVRKYKKAEKIIKNKHNL